jgi:hypothetical protein
MATTAFKVCKTCLHLQCIKAGKATYGHLFGTKQTIKQKWDNAIWLNRFKEPLADWL